MDVDSTPQYPVDTVTATVMQDSGAGDAPANLDEYMNEALRESGGAGKKSSGRGRGPNGERLKVRAVIVKRSNTGPSGGDRSSGGRGGGRGASVPKKREKVTKREDGFVCVHIYGRDVIVVAPTGEVQLNCGGDTGHNTFRAMNESLNKFGFKLAKSPVDETQWTLGDGKRFLKRYEDGMTIPAPNPPGPGRGLALMQKDVLAGNVGGGFGGRGFGLPFGGRVFGRGRGRGRY